MLEHGSGAEIQPRKKMAILTSKTGSLDGSTGSSGLKEREPSFFDESFSSKDVVGVRRDSKIFWGLSSSPSSSGSFFAALFDSAGRPLKTDAADPPLCLRAVEGEGEGEGAEAAAGGDFSSFFGTWIGVVPPMTKLVPPRGGPLGFPRASPLL